MNILVIGDSSSTNLGDPILTNCTNYLANKICQEKNLPYKIASFDIIGRKYIPSNEHLYTLTEKNSTKFNSKFLQDFKILIKWFLTDKKSFKARLTSVLNRSHEWIFIIAGGAFISNSLVYGLRLNFITRFAEKKNIKIIFNSVGIEKTLFKSLNYPIIRGMLKHSSITHFSTRDSVDILPKITRRQNFYVQTADSGLYAAETYNIKKSQSDIVGIGVISLAAYRSVIKNDPRAKKITEENLMEFWHNIIEQLEKKNIKWKLFTNGGAKDYLVAQKFLKRYGYSEEGLLPLPNTPRDLIEHISGFKAVVAHRLHALIISTSLDIPVVPVLWSEKIQNFANLLDISAYTIWPDPNNGFKAAEFVQDKDFIYNAQTVSTAKQKSFEYLENAIMNTINSY